MWRYATMGALLTALGLAGWSMWLQARNAALSADVERLSAALATCDARTRNITEDKESDRAADDFDLRDLPADWLR